MATTIRANFHATRRSSCCVVASAQRPRINAVDVAKRTRKDLTAFPGEDAPKTGRRVPPALVASYDEEDTNSHRLMSADEYETLFPTMVRSSIPLNFVKDPEATEPHAGPGSGKRTAPKHADTVRAPLMHQPTEKSSLRKQVFLRRANL